MKISRFFILVGLLLLLSACKHEEGMHYDDEHDDESSDAYHLTVDSSNDPE